jgi:hypothetical protein
MLKQTQKAQVQITEIGELQVFSRKNKMDYSKRMLEMETADKQRIFGEVRNSLIPVLRHVSPGDIVEIDYFFAGSEKDGKKYNNIIVVNISKINNTEDYGQ